tara:strand:+ start:1919 stop:2662 length:744 start_codon:yes stop_codon:yes gene_type:complete
MQIVNEGLKAGDLEGVVSNRFSIDQYKSKMGEDASIVVLAFTVDSLAPAKDLERFAETGCPSVLDADATPGTMEDGKHKVFVEFPRDEKVVTNIMGFIEDVKKLTNIDEFQFTYRKNENPSMVSLESLSTTVPTDADAYGKSVSEAKESAAKQFFDTYNMLECKLNENILQVKKIGSDQVLTFEIHHIGETTEVLKESKAFAIDMDSIAECTHLTKYFGPYDITKTLENKFIFTKGHESAVISKNGW